MMNNLPYAEEVNYWKSGRSDPSAILNDITEMIENNGGTVTRQMSGTMGNQSAILLEFETESDCYRISWPVLPLKTDEPTGADKTAAIRQAATFIKHDVKAALLKSKVLGFKAAFSPMLLINNQTMNEHLLLEKPASNFLT